MHTNAPIYLAGIARPGPTLRENRAVHAMARILLHGRIDNIQCSWVKLGDDGCRAMLSGGVNDLGGTLMEETISRMAGSEHGSLKTIVGRWRRSPHRAGRPPRSAPRRTARSRRERVKAARATDGVGHFLPIVSVTGRAPGPRRVAH